MAKPSLKQRVIKLKKSGMGNAEIKAQLDKEGIKTSRGRSPSVGYIAWIASANGATNRYKKTGTKKRVAKKSTALSVPFKVTKDTVCIVFGSPKKVEKALGMLRDIYSSVRKA
jgi:hypothetical protein